MPEQPATIGAYAAHLPSYRLGTTSFGADGDGARRSRAVAAHDEDAVTLAVEAGRPLPLTDGPLLLATSEPPYLDKGSAATVHAALGRGAASAAVDLVGLRSGATGLLLALRTGGTIVAADLRTPAPGSADELAHGDAAVAFDAGPAHPADAPPAATLLGEASVTTELLDRWRAPGAPHPTVWDERFTAGPLAELMLAAAAEALAAAGLERADHVVVSCANPRAAAPVRKRLGSSGEDATLEAFVGHTGAAHLGLLLADALDRAQAGQTILAVSGADGADALVLRVESGIADANRGRPIRTQLERQAFVPYDRFLRWRGLLRITGAHRPDPAPPAAPPMLRTGAWKFGLVANRCGACGQVTTPPGRVCAACGATDGHQPVSLREQPCRVVSFTVDHLTPTPAPPLIVAIVDIEGGGRRSVQVTDAPAEGIAVGDVLRPTFRRLSSTDGIHNYFWKVRPEAA